MQAILLLYVIGLAAHCSLHFICSVCLALTFTGKFRGTREQEHHVHESPAAMTVPLIILAILSAIGGFVGIPEIFVKNGNKLGDFLSPVFAHSNKYLPNIHVPHQTEIILMIVSVILILLFPFGHGINIKIIQPY